MKSMRQWLGMAFVAALLIAPSLYAEEGIKANIPFNFEVGKKTLPAGNYLFRIHRQQEEVAIEGPKGHEADALFLTTLAAQPHTQASDFHIVFDEVKGQHILSELWEPGGEGILLHATKGAHQHRVLHIHL